MRAAPFLRFLVLTAGFFGQVVGLGAQSPDTAHVLSEVVISGTLREVSRLESPVPTEVYRPQFFQRSAATTLFEGLGQVTGVQPLLACGVCYTGDIHINGLEGPYTLVLIDGMPIVSGLATVYGFSGIPNSLIQQVEIIRGPGGVLYGSEAMAGILNIRTLQPWQAPRFSMAYQVNSYLESNLDVGASFRRGKMSGLVSLNTYQHHSRWDRNADNFTDLPLTERYSVFSKWALARPSHRRASVGIRYTYEDRFGGELQWQPIHRGRDQVYGESIYTQRVELIGVYDLPVPEKLSLGFSITHHGQNSAYGKVAYQANQTIFFGQLTWERQLARHELLAGAALRHTSYDDSTPATFSALLSANAPSRIALPGLFLQDEWKLNDKQSLLVGARWDLSSVHGAIYSARVNYRLDVAPLTSVRLGAGNGFRVVNLFTEDHAALTGAREVVLAEDLAPEESWNIHANILSYLPTANQGIVTIDGSIFFTRFDNQILPDYESNPDQILYSNLDGHSVSRGASVQVEYRGEGPLEGSAGITYLDVQVTTAGESTRQPLTPSLQGTFQVRYRWPKTGWTLDYTGQVYGPMRLPVVPQDFRPGHSPWFTLQNVQLSRLLGRWELYGALKNIWGFVPQDPILRPFDPFDRTANDPVTNPNGYSFDTQYAYAPLQGRTMVLGVRLSVP